MSLGGRKEEKKNIYIYKSELFHKRKIKIQLLAAFTYRTKKSLAAGVDLRGGRISPPAPERSETQVSS